MLFFPKLFDPTVDVDGWPGSSNDFLLLGFSKNIHFLSYRESN